MSYLGTFNGTQAITFFCHTHDPETGAAADADTAPAYRLYNSSSQTVVASGTMSKWDDSNTLGLYYGTYTISGGTFAVNDFGMVEIAATVNGVSGRKNLTFNVLPSVDVARILLSSTVASNLKAAYDGTGYVGGTIKQAVDAVAISGDSTAADNLEAAFDGTGYSALNNAIRDAIKALVVESQGSVTLQQAISIILAAVAGVTTSGGNTFKTPNGVSTRIVATVDASAHERDAIVLTPSS